MRVAQRCASRAMFQCVSRDTFGFAVPVRGLKRGSQRLLGSGVPGRSRHQVSAPFDGIVAAAQRDQRGDMLDNQFGRYIVEGTEWRNDCECPCRLPPIVEVAREHLSRMRIGLPGGGGPLQEGFRLGMPSVAQQQFTQCREGRRPIRIAFDGVSQDPLRACRIAKIRRSYGIFGTIFLEAN